jgi:protein-tyrosine phosphatase
MGNICRSPTAEGVLRHKLALRGMSNVVEVASAGTHAHHIGDAPDPRAQAHAAKRGYDLSKQRARRLRSEDFANFDHLLAMDWDNLALMEEKCSPEHKRKVGLLMRFARKHDTPIVPDPYYGGLNGFEVVLDYIEDACDGLIEVALARPA